MSDYFKCNRCGGDGYNWTGGDEFEPPVQDACYRCGATGKVSYDTYCQGRIEQAASSLAHIAIQEDRRCRDENPDGEDWSFCAAENMMSVYDYTLARTYEREADFVRDLGELFKTHPSLADSIVTSIVGPIPDCDRWTEEDENPQGEEYLEPITPEDEGYSWPSDDEIPF